MGESGPSNPGLLHDTTRADLESAWGDREAEAAHLAKAGHRAMAAAMRCYALEIRIKAIICHRLDLKQLPRACKTHDLQELIIFTGLWAELNNPTNGTIEKNWYAVVGFSRKHLNLLRYRPEVALPRIDADDLDATLDDPQHGVLAWLSKLR